MLGAGSSALELASELRRHARSVTLAARSSTHVTGRRIGPVPIDWFDSPGNSRLPWSVRRRLFGPMTKLAAGGDPSAHGLPAPPRRVGDKPMAVSDELVAALRNGTVRTAAPVVSLGGDHVVLADGRTLPAQAILHGTGYEVAFPFLPPDCEAQAPGTDVSRCTAASCRPPCPGCSSWGSSAPTGP